MAKEAQTFNYEALVIAAAKAREEIATWPEWKQRAAAASFVSRPSAENEREAPEATPVSK